MIAITAGTHDERVHVFLSRKRFILGRDPLENCIGERRASVRDCDAKAERLALALAAREPEGWKLGNPQAGVYVCSIFSPADTSA